MNHFCLSVFLFSFFTSGTSCFAQSEQKKTNYSLPQIVAVEARIYNPKSDLTLWTGVLPLDDFYKALTLGLGYTISLSDNYKWGIINGHAAFTSDTGLKKDLLKNFSVQPQGILDYIKYYTTTDLLYTPIYGKNLLRSQTVIRTEMSLLLSGGIVFFNSGNTAPMAGFGGQIRFFSSPSLSYKLDSRIYYHMDPAQSSSFLLNIGFGVSFDNADSRVAVKD